MSWSKPFMGWSAAVLIATVGSFVLVSGRSRSDSVGTAAPSGSGGNAAAAAQLFRVEGIRWIREQRDRHHPQASPLSARERRLFSGYVPGRVLEGARVRIVERLENPGFFRIFDEANQPYPINFRNASGLALVDTILIARRANLPQSRGRLLFHELVHLVQYDVLGLELYMQLYVDGWLAHGRSYREIPHEQQAYELASRFARPGSAPFSVEDKVRSRFGVALAAAND